MYLPEIIRLQPVLSLVNTQIRRTRLQRSVASSDREVSGLAWMRMMGRESVAYHRATVLERVDDFPGRALAYYTSRGETPMAWGGSGAEALELVGAVTPEAYEAIFGLGGARLTTTGERLVSTQRPGVELVSWPTWP
jgi:hypothetical protein